MPRDVGFACKKRQHPDGLHLSSSVPKRLLSVAEADIGYSVEDASISPGVAIHGSFCNSASSALTNPNCSTSIHSAHSSMSLDVASSKLEGGFVLSRLPSDAASSRLEGVDREHSLTPSNVTSYNLGALNSTRDSLRQGNGKGIWTHRTDSMKHESLDCDGELSEITSEKHAQTLSSGHKPDGISGSEKATHVISRHDGRSLNSKDELWHTATQSESSSKLYGLSQRRDYSFPSMACESASSCATGDTIMPKQVFPHIYPSVRGEFSTIPSHTHTRAEVLVEPRSQEIIGTQRRPSSEVVLCPSFTHEAAIEEIRPSYVLSSGRMSLEEEAKLGRRAPTIDQDFEEYFSSLML